MGMVTKGQVAVVVTGPHFAILCDADTGKALQEALAELVLKGLGSPNEENWHALTDLHGAMVDTFKPKRRTRRPPSQRLPNDD